MVDLLEKIGLGKLNNALIYGVVIALVLAILSRGLALDYGWWAFLFRWLHVLSGVMWIGILWYFNFVQIPTMPQIPNELKPAVSKHIAPAALFWFRWAALSTVITGLILAHMNGYLFDALMLNKLAPGKNLAIGIGMWLGLIMAYNVWMIIWPNQQKALGLVDATAEEKAAAAKVAMLTSRFNTMFSVPMLYFMVAAQNIY
ncbi:MAG: hypothetical protein FJX55_03025 [Alphaproteobacteria bacterium]|nr:hypothetical protein [Alphaproteobacteria bacterium]